ncbi:hypothetical protein GBA52_018067 [Prunus armeniaca]|nr:hypothetical protein GBA52_018067 [Prunus armeniaca]
MKGMQPSEPHGTTPLRPHWSLSKQRTQLISGVSSRCIVTIIWQHLSEEDEWNAFQATVLEEGTFKAQVKKIHHHHTDIKVKEYKSNERINTLKDK